MAQATVAFGRAMVKHGRISLGWEVAGRTTTIDTDGNVSVGGELDFVGGAVGISGSPNGEVTVTGELGPPNSRLTIDSHGNAGLSEGLDTPIGGVTVNHSINLKDVPLVVSAVEAAFQTANQQPLANPCLCSSELTGSEMLRQNATWRLSPDPDDE